MRDPIEIRADSYLVSGQDGHGRYRFQALALVADAAGAKTYCADDSDGLNDRLLEYIATAEGVRYLTYVLPTVAVQMDRYASSEAMRWASDHSPISAEELAEIYRAHIYGYCEGVAEKIRQAEIPGLVEERELVAAEFERRYPGSPLVGQIELDEAGLLAGTEAGRVAGVEIARETGR